MKRVLVVFALFSGMAAPCMAQYKIYRCGNDYVSSITEADAEARKCKLISGGIVAVVPKATDDLESAKPRKRGVSIGMSKQEVLSSNWGKPMSVSRTITALGSREQWVYGSSNYLYFENGVLTAIQN